jgi:hypothetical protein
VVAGILDRYFIAGRTMKPLARIERLEPNRANG